MVPMFVLFNYLSQCLGITDGHWFESGTGYFFFLSVLIVGFFSLTNFVSSIQILLFSPLIR